MLAVAARDMSAEWVEEYELVLRGTVESSAPPTWNSGDWTSLANSSTLRSPNWCCPD
jgi:hypothetical protein